MVFLSGSLRILHSLYEFNVQHKIDSVVHLAALKAVGPSMKNPFLYYKNNLVGTVNLIDVSALMLHTNFSLHILLNSLFL